MEIKILNMTVRHYTKDPKIKKKISKGLHTHTQTFGQILQEELVYSILIFKDIIHRDRESGRGVEIIVIFVLLFADETTQMHLGCTKCCMPKKLEFIRRLFF